LKPVSNVDASLYFLGMFETIALVILKGRPDIQPLSRTAPRKIPNRLTKDQENHADGMSTSVNNSACNHSSDANHVKGTTLDGK
jgi:hypothetical protein